MPTHALFLRTLGLALSLVFAFLTPTAHAFSDNEARTAILELREQIAQIQRVNLQLANQIQEMQDSLAKLRGQLELVSYQQRGIAAESTPGAPEAAAMLAGDPQEQAAYDTAMERFRQSKFKDASQALTAFLAHYPSSPLAPSAQFYLGSSRYALKDYKGAIEQLSALVQTTPHNAHAPDALLIVAGSHIELNRRAAAKTALQRIVREYPHTPAANTAKTRLQLLQ
jgi:tol-pal system protein YbgF